jgi:hypothetical protein
MKKVYIYAPLDYVAGHLRYGHREGTVNLTDEEFEQFKTNPKNFIYDNDVELDLVIDDWKIDDYGEIDRVEWSECKT